MASSATDLEMRNGYDMFVRVFVFSVELGSALFVCIRSILLVVLRYNQRSSRIQSQYQLARLGPAEMPTSVLRAQHESPSFWRRLRSRSVDDATGRCHVRARHARSQQAAGDLHHVSCGGMSDQSGDLWPGYVTTVCHRSKCFPRSG